MLLIGVVGLAASPFAWMMQEGRLLIDVYQVDIWKDQPTPPEIQAMLASNPGKYELSYNFERETADPHTPLGILYDVMYEGERFYWAALVDRECASDRRKVDLTGSTVLLGQMTPKECVVDSYIWRVFSGEMTKVKYRFGRFFSDYSRFLLTMTAISVIGFLLSIGYYDKTVGRLFRWVKTGSSGSEEK